MRILLIEDEEALAQGLKRGLELAHFNVETAADGITGLERALKEEYTLIVIDVLLPGMNGLQICEELRSRRRTVLILMLTACGSVADRIRGLETGADDYLPKPFDLGEFLARVQALVRRERVNRTRKIRIAGLEVDTRTRHVTRNGQEIHLTHKEYLLLEALAAQEGTILSRETIQERIWQDEESYSNVVDVCVGQLRKKVDAAFDMKLIQTVRGVGYRLSRPAGENTP
ncbi:MAG: two component transcriptional regulator, winged helix family [Chthonomonadales bacterium]|nr:two component transcriptional regulator, winged helix family [Chthonomonadales bacterium]